MLTVTWFQSCRRQWRWVVQAEPGLCFIMEDYWSTQSCDITDTSLPELPSSIEQSRDRNPHNSSLETRPSVVLHDAVWPGAGASSQAATTPGCILHSRHSKASQGPFSDWYPGKLLATDTIYSVFSVWAQSSSGWKLKGEGRRHKQPTGNHT